MPLRVIDGICIIWVESLCLCKRMGYKRYDDFSQIDHTKWNQIQLLVVVIRLLLHVLHLFPFTLTYTHILTVLWLYKVNNFCNTSSSSTPLYFHDYDTYI